MLPITRIFFSQKWNRFQHISSNFSLLIPLEVSICLKRQISLLKFVYHLLQVKSIIILYRWLWIEYKIKQKRIWNYLEFWNSAMVLIIILVMACAWEGWFCRKTIEGEICCCGNQSDENYPMKTNHFIIWSFSLWTFYWLWIRRYLWFKKTIYILMIITI